MPEITRERTGQLIRKVFEILIRNQEGMPAREVLAQVEKELPPTAFERSFYESNPSVRRFEKIIRFHTIAPVKAGWMTKDKGSWSITDEGRKAFENYRDPLEFSREAARLYHQWRREHPDTDENDGDEGAAVSRSTTLEEAEEAAWSEVESYLGRMNPYDFQELVAGLLRGMRYYVSWVAPAGPDRGVDIIAHTDPLGIDRGRIKVQVKRRADKIAVGEVRSFLAVLADEDVGIFVATSGFTPDAAAEARQQERRRIMLIDAKRLFDLWVQNYDKIPEPERQLMPLRPVYFLAPID